MAKVKTSFFCQNCGAQYAKWQGQCSSCKAWNTIAEEIIRKEEKKGWTPPESTSKRASKPLTINAIDGSKEMRIPSGDRELDRVLGGGIVPGSVTLLGGEPGIGKSTLLLQMAINLNLTTLYVSGEESQQQIKMRAERINPGNTSCYILTETQTQHIFQHVETVKTRYCGHRFHSDPALGLYRGFGGQYFTDPYLYRRAYQFCEAIRDSGAAHWAYHQRRVYCRPQNSGAHGGYRATV